MISYIEPADGLGKTLRIVYRRSKKEAVRLLFDRGHLDEIEKCFDVIINESGPTGYGIEYVFVSEIARVVPELRSVRILYSNVSSEVVRNTIKEVQDLEVIRI